MKKKKRPYIFISYSWDSGEHKEKVKKFVQDLRLNNINVTYDGDLQFGESLLHYIEKAISDSDIILFVCTPIYKYRADNGISGVGAENQIITGELYKACNAKMFIPILFNGTWETSLPAWAQGKSGVNLSTQKLYETEYQKLILALQMAAPYSTEVGTMGKDKEEKNLYRECM